MRIKVSWVVYGVMSLALIFGAIPPSAAAKEKVIEIKTVTWHPVRHRLTTDSFLWLAAEIEKRTKGKVKFKWFLGGSLMGPDKTHDAVQGGVIDMAMTLAPFAFMHLYPISTAIGLPFMVDSAAHASDMGWEMWETIPEMKQEYSGMKFFGLSSSAISNLATVGAPPKTLNDLKGLRILVWHKQMVEAHKLLGGTGQFMRTADFYLAIQRGMADGAWFPDAPLRSYRLIELMGNHTMVNYLGAPQAIVMNLKKWKTLPPDVQKVFNDLTPSMARLHGHTLTNEAKWVIQDLKDRGDNFYYLPADERAKWIEKSKPMYDRWIQLLNKKGWDGQAIFDKVVAISKKYRKNPLPDDSWWGRAGRKTGAGFIPVEKAQ